MYLVTAYIVGLRTARKWTVRSEIEAERFIADLQSRGFRETSADQTVCTFYGPHRIMKIELRHAQEKSE